MLMKSQEPGHPSAGAAAAVALADAPHVDADDEQLHGRACIRCGRRDGELVDAGYLQVENRPGQLLPWAVVAHLNCAPGAAC